eukprot:jgi/Mesvir1/13843/Mv15988-RA.2
MQSLGALVGVCDAKAVPSSKVINQVRIQQATGISCCLLPKSLCKPRGITSIPRKKSLMALPLDGKGHSCVPAEHRGCTVASNPVPRAPWKDSPGGVEFTCDEIAAITGGLSTPSSTRTAESGSVSTDSRQVAAGQWFLALQGTSFDGHSFLGSARDRKCIGAVGSIPYSAEWGAGMAYVQVGDTLAALQALAHDVRLRFEGPVVAVTGSCGKTTTRAMIGLVLKAFLGRVHESAGNLNNHIGVPLTLLKTPSDAKAVVLEMGMNHLREIHRLQEIGAPTVRVITNVGAVHLDGCGSIEGVASAKAELFDGARPGDTCVVNMDDPFVRKMTLPEGINLIRFGSRLEDGCDLLLSDVCTGADGFSCEFTLTHRDVSRGGAVISTVNVALPFPGTHLAINACAAAAVGLAVGCPLGTAAAALPGYQPVGLRMRVDQVNLPAGGTVTLINDAYNANPVSVAAALRMLGGINPRGAQGRRVALLGDMLELGPAALSMHEDILRQCLASDVGVVGLVGPLFAEAAASIGTKDGGGDARRKHGLLCLGESPFFLTFSVAA